MQRRLAARHDIEIGLAAAIDEDRLIVDFEPVIVTDDQRVVAARCSVTGGSSIGSPARWVDMAWRRARCALPSTASTSPGTPSTPEPFWRSCTISV